MARTHYNWRVTDGVSLFMFIHFIQTQVIINPTVAGASYLIEVSALSLSESKQQYYALAAAGEFIITNKLPPPPPTNRSVLSCHELNLQLLSAQ
jgi:hypothetical protein